MADTPDTGTATATTMSAPPPDTSSVPPTSDPASHSPNEAMASAAKPATAEVNQAWQTAHGTNPEPVLAPQGQAAPVVLQPLTRHGIAGVMDSIGKFLAGTQGSEVYYDQDGNRYIQHPPQTHAQQWAQVGLNALQGAARGLAAGQGPGGPGKALFASVQGGISDRLKADQLKDEDARKDWAMQRQAKLDKATMQIQQMRIAEMSLSHDRQEFEFTEAKKNFADQQQDRYKAMGGHAIPGYYHSDDFHEIKKVAPNVWNDHFEHANIMPVQTAQGTQFWEIPPDRLDAPVAPHTKIPVWVPDDSKQYGHTVDQELPEGSTVRDEEKGRNDWFLKSGAALERRTKEAGAIEAETKAQYAPEMAKLGVTKEKAGINALNAEADLRRAEADAKRAGEVVENTPDTLGFKPNVEGMGGIKEYNKRLNMFKKNLDGLASTESSTYQFADTLNNLAAGKPMTGAESVVGLFNAIGLSVAPLKGMGGGVRVTKNMIEQHELARGWAQGLQQKFLDAKEGDVITPDQLRGYARIALNSRFTQYVNTVNEMHNLGLGADAALPVGNGKPLDPNTAQIFFEVAGRDPAKATAAAAARGWEVPPSQMVKHGQP